MERRKSKEKRGDLAAGDEEAEGARIELVDKEGMGMATEAGLEEGGGNQLVDDDPWPSKGDQYRVPGARVDWAVQQLGLKIEAGGIPNSQVGAKSDMAGLEVSWSSYGRVLVVVV